MPEQFAAFQKAVSGGSEVEIVRSVTNAVASAKSRAEAPAISGDEARRLNSGYQASWELALGVRRLVQTSEAKEVILRKWDSGLKDNGSIVRFQLYALGKEWDRNLLTQSFWGLFRDTQDEKTLSAICLLLYERGEATDIKALVEKVKSGIPGRLQGIVVNAINWLNYRLGSKLTPDGRPDPGPAHAPPHWEE